MDQSRKTVLLFGDQVDTWVDDFAQVRERAACTPWLQDYLDDLGTCFSTEIRALQFDEPLQLLGSFTSLADLADHYRHNADEFGVVQCLLLHTVRSATLLELVKRNPHYLQRDNATEWLGISGGLITLSAAAVAETFDQLREASLVIARLFVRLCHTTLVRSRAVESGSGRFCWVILGIKSNELQKALSLFQSSIGIPTHRLAQVAVTGFGWTSVIGPPSVLSLIMNQCSALKDLSKYPLEIHALQHTLSLEQSELDFVVGQDAAWLRKPIKDPPFHLWGMDQPAQAYTSWAEMLRSICAQVLCKPLNIPEVIDELGRHMSSTKHLEIIQVGATSHAPSITTALKSQSRQVELHDGKVLLASSHSAAQGGRDHRIAIVGASGRGPGCDNRDELWERIMAKEDMCTEVPKDRFDIDAFYENGNKCSMNTRFGCFMENPGHFDSRFFHISPREAMLMDPGHRQFLMSVYEALEDAGYSDSQTAATLIDRKRIATFYGQVTDDWHDHTHPTLGCDAYTLQGVQRAFGSGRVAWQFKWEGPTYSLDSACASSTAGVHMACMSLRDRDIDMAVVGAANILCYPHSFACLGKSGVLSPTGNCKTFRDDADGYCRADFVGAVVLKRLDDAIAHNDNILAVVAGSGRNHSGNATSMTTSDAGAQERLFRNVMNRAYVSPDQVSYVEMHGTGTQTGDVAEVAAVSNLFKRRKAQLGPIPVGSSKANFGHSEGAAGLVSLLKCIKMYESDKIPPQAGMPHALNHNFPPLKELGIEIPHEAMKFPQPGASDPVRRILLNNFDAAGGNACLLLEDYKAPTQHKLADPRPRHVVVTSARTPSAHMGNCKRLLTWLRANRTASLADLAYTTTARRMHHPIRLAFSVSSNDELICKLEETIERSLPKPAHQPDASITFVFSGQGSHFVGMGGHLYSTSPVFHKHVDLCTNICREHGFPEFVDLIANGSSPSAHLADASTVQTQLAVVTLEIALAAFWSSVGVRPSLVIGHSLGEYAALHVAGVLSLADTLYLVGKRAQLLIQRCAPDEFGMLAVRMTATDVGDMIRSQPQFSSCTIACLNTAGDTVVSGSRDAVAALQHQLGRQSRLLNVPYAFHSFQMDQVASEFVSIASRVVFSSPTIPVSSTLYGEVLGTDGTFDAQYLARQMRQPVNFIQAVCAASAMNKGGIWLELGPRDECSNFVRKTLNIENVLPTLASPRLDNDWTNISNALATLHLHGIAIDWMSLHSPYEDNLTLISLPSYSWDVIDYWMAYSEPDQSQAHEAQVKTKLAGISSCAQYVIEKSVSASQITLSMGASLADPQFHRAMYGHTMQDQPICPGSVFCEAAYATVFHLLENNHRAADAQLVKLGIQSPVMTKPLTSRVAGIDGQLITTAKVENSSPNHIHVVWQASAAGSRHTIELGRCTIVVRSSAEDEQATWGRMAHYVKACVDGLVRLAKDGAGHRFKHEIFYSIFASTVQYDEKYRCIQEAIVAEDFSEAVAEVVLQDDPTQARFAASPYWGEALVHIAGFLVNADPKNGPQHCFINSGFQSFDQTIIFQPGTRYTSYVRTTQRVKEKQTLDLFVFNGNRIVAQCLGLSFHQVSKASLARSLGGGVEPSPVQRPSPIMSNQTPNSRKAIASPSQELHRQDSVLQNTSDESPPRSSSFLKITEVIAEQTGMDRSDLGDDVALADIGVDSIMSIEVATIVSEATGLELLPSFVFEYPTIGDLRRAFDTPKAPTISERSTRTEARDFAQQISNHDSTTVSEFEATQENDANYEGNQRGLKNSADLMKQISNGQSTTTTSDRSHVIVTPSRTPSPGLDESRIKPEAKIVLLKGSARKNKQTPLYMIADGTGNIATYLHLIPALASTMPIYGINSPFLRCPEQFTAEVGIPGAAKYIVQALLAKHPPGSSTQIWLGGYSGGAMLAYEVARQLEQDHGGSIVISRLLLIDMVAPRISQLPNDDAIGSTLYDAVTKGEGDANIWELSDSTKAHLRACFTAVASYDPPLTRLSAMKTAIIWARRGMIDRCSHDKAALELLRRSGVALTAYDGFMEDPRLGSVIWSLPHKREQDVGTNGWERRVDDDKLKCFSVEADHLQMMTPGFVTELGNKIDEILGWFGE